MEAGGGIASPAQLLEALQKQGAGAAGSEPPLEELLEAMRASGGAAAAPPPDADAVEVFPEPGFVIKTVNEQGQKVFINVCGSSKLALPDGWHKGQPVPEEVRRHLEEAEGGDAPPAMRFPVSLGSARFDTDHRGEPCLVLDCIVNGEVLAQCGQYRPLKLFVIQLALGLVAQKFDMELDPQYRLPKMRYKGGTPPPQRIRSQAPGPTAGGGAGGAGSLEGSAQQEQLARPGSAGSSGKPLIAEVGPDGEEVPAFALLASKRQQRQRQAAGAWQAPPAAAAKPQEQAAAPPPQRQQQRQQEQQQQASAVQLQPQVEYEGKPAAAVCITLPLPAEAAAAALQDPAAISASVCAETVRVAVPGCQPAEVRLPFAVSAAGSSAELQPAGSGGAGAAAAGSGSSLVLRLRLPYRPFASVLQELRQAAGAAEGSGSGGGGERSSLMDLD